MIAALLVLWVAAAAVAAYGVWRYQHRIGRRAAIETPIATAVILPVRDNAAALPALWTRLQRQDYRGWRLIVAVESADDPACAVLRRLIDAGSVVPAEIVIAGAAATTGQKVHNQRAALARLTDADAAIAFADADILPETDWLTRLIRPLADPAIDVVSGYRWLVPADRHPATLLICAASQSIATLTRSRRRNIAWGGSMALRRETLARLGGADLWAGSASDDLTLTRAVRAQAGTILSPRTLLLPTEVAYDWRTGLAFVRRQYRFVRLYLPALWLFAVAANGLLASGWIVAIGAALHGSRLAVVALGAVIALDQARATWRRRVVAALWGEAGLARLAPVLRLDRWASPVWLGFHALVVWSTLFGRTIRWADRRYRILAPDRLVILDAPRARVHHSADDAIAASPNAKGS